MTQVNIKKIKSYGGDLDYQGYYDYYGYADDTNLIEKLKNRRIRSHKQSEHEEAA